MATDAILLADLKKIDTVCISHFDVESTVGPLCINSIMKWFPVGNSTLISDIVNKKRFSQRESI